LQLISGGCSRNTWDRRGCRASTDMRRSPISQVFMPPQLSGVRGKSGGRSGDGARDGNSATSRRGRHPDADARRNGRFRQVGKARQDTGVGLYDELLVPTGFLRRRPGHARPIASTEGTEATTNSEGRTLGDTPSVADLTEEESDVDRGGGTEGSDDDGGSRGRRGPVFVLSTDGDRDGDLWGDGGRVGIVNGSRLGRRQRRWDGLRGW
jgi:hypothetical protein